MPLNKASNIDFEGGGAKFDPPTPHLIGLTLPATGSRFRGCHGGGLILPPPSKSMLEALLRGMMKIVIDCHIILGPHEKNQDQINLSSVVN